jgi:phage host-nuclease inhibitor protein Gam
VNREVLTEDNKVKTVDLPGGRVLWRFNPRSIYLKNEKAAIEELDKAGLAEFIRIKKEVNKEAILEKPESIADFKNVKVVQGKEVFAVKPADVKVELEKSRGKIKSKKV